MLVKSNPEEAKKLLKLAEEDVDEPLETLRLHGAPACERRGSEAAR